MQAQCLNSNCEFNDPQYEDNCSASETICNACQVAEWDDSGQGGYYENI